MLKERLFVTFIPDVKMWTSFKQYFNVHGEHNEILTNTPPTRNVMERYENVLCLLVLPITLDQAARSIERPLDRACGPDCTRLTQRMQLAS